MAKLFSILDLRGKIGDLEFSKVGEETIVKAKAAHVNQSEGTIRAAQIFGSASACAGRVRKAILPWLNIHFDGSAVNRLNKRMLDGMLEDPEWYHLSSLTRFSFNQDTKVDQLLLFPAQLHRDFNGNVLVTIRSHENKIVRKQPERASHVAIKAISLQPDFRTGEMHDQSTAPVIHELKQPIESFTLEIPSTPDQHALITLEVCFLEEVNGKLYQIGGREMYAADILGVIRPHKTTPELYVPPVRNLLRPYNNYRKPAPVNHEWIPPPNL